MPDWSENAFETESGLLELKSFVAKHFGLKVGPDGKLARGKQAPAKFKTKSNTDIGAVEACRGIATSCARIVAQASVAHTNELNWSINDPSQLRNFALQFSMHNWVDFEALVRACWAINIPVLYLPELGTVGKKMDGMVTFVSGKSVIILTKKAKPDWLLFILAHELGHIGNGHLENIDGEAILDESISKDSNFDTQETEANAYAVSVVTPDGKGLKLTALLNAKAFAAAAVRHGTLHGISPGHVILSAANNTRVNGKPLFSLGNAALNVLPSELVSRPVEEVCREALVQNLNLDLISSNSYEFLEKMKIV
jgi:hypothetical protein